MLSWHLFSSPRREVFRGAADADSARINVHVRRARISFTSEEATTTTATATATKAATTAATTTTHADSHHPRGLDGSHPRLASTPSFLCGERRMSCPRPAATRVH